MTVAQERDAGHIRSMREMECRMSANGSVFVWLELKAGLDSRDVGGPSNRLDKPWRCCTNPSVIRTNASDAFSDAVKTERGEEFPVLE